ncbi:MAG: ATP-binding protein [Firmicutes bacterium]|nr:ATP-binding protein [Bacillota bacterium]
MLFARKRYLPITIDKSHLITIGERMYAESIELIRELVNNAYDADATIVKILISPEEIRIEDNGSGMDMRGLRQYFNLGSPEKKINPVSPKFKRQRIGQFGIGKFASLAAAENFQIYTQHTDFAAKVTFDKIDWEKNGGKWLLPLEILTPDPQRGDGTTISLSKLTKEFDPLEVELRLRESVPLKASHFLVYINDKRLVPKMYSGHKLPFLEGTEFGTVHGEIIILPASKATGEIAGIDIKVKQVTVKRELFDLPVWGKDAARVRGEIHADFLPITSDRTNFILDSPEYKAFLKVMEKILDEVKNALGKISGKSERIKAKKALKDALYRIQKALIQHPEFSPFALNPDSSGDMAQNIKPEITEGKRVEKEAKKAAAKKKKGKKAKVNAITPDAVIQKMKLGTGGVTCCLDNFGTDGPESVTEGTIIYINKDHPLYIRELRKPDAHTMHIARLLAQEISLMKDPRNPRQAYERQSVLLRDAFIE